MAEVTVVPGTDDDFDLSTDLFQLRFDEEEEDWDSGDGEKWEEDEEDWDDDEDDDWEEDEDEWEEDEEEDWEDSDDAEEDF